MCTDDNADANDADTNNDDTQWTIHDCARLFWLINQMNQKKLKYMYVHTVRTSGTQIQKWQYHNILLIMAFRLICYMAMFGNFHFHQ